MEAGDANQRWQATVKRLCLYMGLVPVAVGVMLWRDMNPLLILALAASALVLFIAIILWTYSRLQDDPTHD